MSLFKQFKVWNELSKFWSETAGLGVNWNLLEDDFAFWLMLVRALIKNYQQDKLFSNFLVIYRTNEELTIELTIDLLVSETEWRGTDPAKLTKLATKSRVLFAIKFF